jgi:hypothetical protein
MRRTRSPCSACAVRGQAAAAPPSRMTKSRRRIPDTRASPSQSVRRILSLPPPGWQVPGTDLNCSESTGWRGHRAAGREPEACGVTDPVSPRAASPDSGAANVLALAPTAEPSPAPENFFSKTPFTERLPLFGAETVFGQAFGRGGMTEISK